MFEPGDRVVILGEVSTITPHKNGVVGITIRFGTGVARQVVVPDSIVHPADLLEMASTFDVLPYDRHRRLRIMQVVRRSVDPEAWAIVSDGGGSCLAHDGEWEWESLPSSRTDDFLERCRWPSAGEAIAFAKDHLRKYPTGFKEDAEGD